MLLYLDTILLNSIGIMSSRAPRRDLNTFAESIPFGPGSHPNQIHQEAYQVVSDLLNKGGVQERLHHAGIDPIDMQRNLGDYAEYLIENGDVGNFKSELAAQLFSRVSTAEVLNAMRAKSFASGEIPF